MTALTFFLAGIEEKFSNEFISGLEKGLKRLVKSVRAALLKEEKNSERF